RNPAWDIDSDILEMVLAGKLDGIRVRSFREPRSVVMEAGIHTRVFVVDSLHTGTTDTRVFAYLLFSVAIQKPIQWPPRTIRDHSSGLYSQFYSWSCCDIRYRSTRQNDFSEAWSGWRNLMIVF